MDGSPRAGKARQGRAGQGRAQLSARLTRCWRVPVSCPVRSGLVLAEVLRACICGDRTRTLGLPCHDSTKEKNRLS